MESVCDQWQVITNRNPSSFFPVAYWLLCASDVGSKGCLRHPKADSQVVDVPADNLCVIFHYYASIISTSTLGWRRWCKSSIFPPHSAWHLYGISSFSSGSYSGHSLMENVSIIMDMPLLVPLLLWIGFAVQPCIGSKWCDHEQRPQAFLHFQQSWPESSR